MACGNSVSNNDKEQQIITKDDQTKAVILSDKIKRDKKNKESQDD